MTKTEFSEYLTWVEAMWSSQEALTGRDFAIMGLGLAGEAGELHAAISEFLTSGKDEARALAVKEAGDVLYYWARIIRACRLDEGLLLSEFGKPCVVSGRPNADAAALRLYKGTSDVAETLKKVVREGELNTDKLTQAMTAVASALRGSLLCVQATVDEVVSTNRSKLEDRKRRGVMLGSGDNR